MVDTVAAHSVQVFAYVENGQIEGEGTLSRRQRGEKRRHYSLFQGMENGFSYRPPMKTAALQYP